MAGCRNQNKSKGKFRSNKHNSNTVDDLSTNIDESSQSGRNSDSQSPTNPETKNSYGVSDKQREKFVLKKCERIYKEAHRKLMSYGYERNKALNAVLTNGHAVGDSDVVTNIVQNALNYIKTGQVLDNGTRDFGDLRTMTNYSLTEMVSLLRQIQPNLTKWQAMECLFLSNFHLGVAGTKYLPFASNEGENHDSSDIRKSCLKRDSGGDCRRDSKPLTPSLACQLKTNVADYAAAFRANMKVSREPPQTGNNSQPTKAPLDGFEGEESCMVDQVLGDFCSQDNRRPESDPKIATILNLVDQIKEVRKEEKERKEWAERKVIQAAEKLNDHLIELRQLRMEGLKNQQHKLETEEVKKRTETEDTLRKVSFQADLAEASVLWLEEENAKIKAELEAFKLNASESDSLCLESRKNERKLPKNIMALEKQNNKLHEEIAEEETETLQLQQPLICLRKAQEDIEVRWRQELQAKELSITQVQDELRLKEEDEIEFKGKQEAMHQNMEVDCQRCKDDVQRLEQEIYNLQLSLECAVPYHLPPVAISESQLERSGRDLLTTPLPNSSLLPDISMETYSRTCLMCMEKEASVVFLPCAHQVLCASCNKDRCRNVGYRCPCCQALISQTIWVYGMNA